MRNVRVKAGLLAGCVLLAMAACGKSEKPMGGKWAEDPPWKACETTDCPTQDN